MKKPIQPIVVKRPKRRIPMAPPGVEYRDKKVELKHMPSRRRAKHKKKVE
ncbi:MAG: hypothetical protein AAB225_25660 [Acidobacteriota bacterium]